MECHQLYYGFFVVTLFNLSLEQSNVPTSWKLVKVLPVHNKSDRNPVSNQAFGSIPVSLLSVVSEVKEKCIHNNVSVITN